MYTISRLTLWSNYNVIYRRQSSHDCYQSQTHYLRFLGPFYTIYFSTEKHVNAFGSVGELSLRFIESKVSFHSVDIHWTVNFIIMTYYGWCTRRHKTHPHTPTHTHTRTQKSNWKKKTTWIEKLHSTASAVENWNENQCPEHRVYCVYI